MSAALGMLVALAGLGALVWVRVRTHLAYFQQEEYDNARFLRAVLRVRLVDIRASAATVLLWAMAQGLGWGAALPFALGVVWAGIAAWEARWRFKKPLAMTDRARRLFALAAGLGAVVALGLTVWHPLGAVAGLQALPLALIAANLMLAPLQARINARFTAEAQAKLAALAPVTIGITGSFGKTTVKHILAELLAPAGPVFWSRGSINTVLGLTRHIRERLQPAHRFFVAEMGAYGIGSIARLCRFAQPRYGIVTAVGLAHAERFGSLKVTARAKSELVAAVLDRDGVAVIAEDVAPLAPFAALRERAPDRVLVVGRGAGCDVRITAAEGVGDDWQVTLAFPFRPGTPDLTLTLPLLGAHNVTNLALAVAMVAVVAPDALPGLPRIAPNIPQIPHRLQKKDTGQGPLILDDAYNANEDGFLNALDVARELADRRGGRAVLVTPGVAELGSAHDAVHARLGQAAAAAADVVLAIGPERLGAFIRAAQGGRAQVQAVASLAEARAALGPLSLGPADVLLYENDLPDLLEDRRLL